MHPRFITYQSLFSIALVALLIGCKLLTVAARTVITATVVGTLGNKGWSD